MLVLRSVAYNVLFYLNLILHMLVGLPTLLMPRGVFMAIAKSWGRTSNALLAVAGISVELRGREKIPPGALLVASKHQSFWEAFTLLTLFDDPAFIVKRELMWIPLFGWYAKKQRMIPVDRGARGKVMVEVLKRTKEELSTGRQLIIYPEGTRRAPGDTPDYRYGIARIYRDMQVPVVPIVAHWGLFWGRRKLIKHPGHFKVRILPPIQPGMDPDAFHAHLVETLEAASDQLLIETVDANPHLPLPPTAAKRLAELRAQSAA